MGILVSITHVNYWAQYWHSFTQEPVICSVTLGHKPQLHMKNLEKYIYDNMGIRKKVDYKVTCTGFSQQQFVFVISLIFRLTEQFEVVCLSEMEKT